MKKIFYQQFFLVVAAALLTTFTMVSCNNGNRANRNWLAENTHAFPNTNWAFEEEVLDFDFDIKDTTKRYDVLVSLVYDTAVATLQDIPLSFTLSTPDGMKSFSTSHFLLNRKDNPDIRLTGEGSNAEVDVLVYPERKFKVPGKYTLTVYRRAEKADNLGFISLTTKVGEAK